MAREIDAAQLSGSATASTSPNLTQYINISDYVYSSGMTPFTKTLQKELGVKPLVYQGKIVKSLDNATGFYGEAFVTTGSAPKQVIIGFEGTNLVNPPTPQFQAAQIAADINIYNGVNAPGYTSALNFTNTVLGDVKNLKITSPVTLTGHSLGAAQVEYVATQTGLAGTSFGTPGIPSSDFAGKPASNLTNYVEYGDPVGNYSADSPDLLGPIVTSPSILHYGQATLTGPGTLEDLGHAAILVGAAVSYATKTDAGYAAAAAALGYAAYNYHPLGTYASDLKVPLYIPDRTAGSGQNFFSQLCFASGTLIRTEDGDVAVEDLQVGAQAITASGTTRTIRWIGHRVVDFATHPAPSQSWPVRVRAGAFGGGLPERDLCLSPGHPVLVGSGANEVLVPIMCLINGTSIERLPVDTVTYWHVELDAHDILLAEGLPAESFIDLGNRAWFAGADDILADPDLVAPGCGARCRPVAIDGPLVEAERRRLDALFEMSLVAPCAWPSGDADAAWA